MANKKSEQWDFPHFLHSLRQGASLCGQFLESVHNISQEVKQDAICGSWIARQGNINALIRKSPGGYAVIICDMSKCYKYITNELFIRNRKGRLFITQCDGRLSTDTVFYDEHTEVLRIGEYGLFETEEDILRKASFDNDFDFDIPHE